LGYSSFTSLLGEFAYTDTNWFGRGQRLRLSVQASSITRQIQFSFTEPYFLDRPLSAGFDLYKVSTDFTQANYRSDVTAGVLRLGFPVSEFSSVSLSARYQVEKVRFFGLTSAVANQSGSFNGIIMGVTYGYNNLDDVRKPTKGISFSLSQSFAGFTGNMKFLDSGANFNAYTPLFGGAVVGSFGARAGYITGYNGYPVPFEERKFIGGETFRGFALAGVGPRDINAPRDTGALGGTVFAVGTLEARLPALLPPSWGVSAGLFTDFGTLGRLDVKPPDTGPCILHSQLGSCIKDNLAFRASAGVSVGWKSPFGPIQIDIGLPFVKTKYDRAQIIHFSTATGL
jgi:outer membrane protein insertion porin family